MTASRLGWYLRRLRRMSAQEVLFRTQDAGRRRVWARRQIRPGGRPAPAEGVLPDRSFPAILPVGTVDRVPPAAAAAVIAAADRVLAGEWTVLGVRRSDSADPDWFLDPLTGRRAPEGRLAFRVNQRDEMITGNVKQVWEMSRHHHLTVLAAAWWLTEQPKYAEAAASQLRSWWQANPFLSGIHWTSGIEAGIRVISWVWIRRLLDSWPKVGDLFENNDQAIRQIAWHQEFLAAFPSRGSSANNHVIAEAAGRLAGACAFGWYTRTPQWREQAINLFERSLATNTFASGPNRELATDYHRFVLELGLCAAVEADCQGSGLSDGTWHRLARMLDAGTALLDVNGHPPRQGDGDEGRALIVDDPQTDPWAVALSAGRGVLGAPLWWPTFEGSVQEVLLGALSRPRDQERYPQRPDRFADAGVVLLRSRPADGAQIWCRCDGGPHGFLSIAAHAHADALSLELRHDGVELLVDPGTYCYHGEPEWRQWFRSTAAHNTLQLAGVDQSESGGPFLWSTQASTTTSRCALGDLPVQRWEAWHDGYLRLEVPTRHRRSVSLDSLARTLTVVDTLETAGAVPLLLSWHLGPDVSVDLQGARANLAWSINGQSRQAEIRLPDELSWSRHRGEENPIRGWYSPGFGQRVPATSLLGFGTGSSTTHLVTVIDLPAGPAADVTAVSPADAAPLLFRRPSDDVEVRRGDT